MATIKETLTLTDQFSANFSKYVNLAQNASVSTKQLKTEAARARAEASLMSAASTQAAAAAKASAATEVAALKTAEAQYRAKTSAAKQAAAASKANAAALNEQTAAIKLQIAQQRLAASATKETKTQTDALTGSITRLAASFLSIQAFKGIISLSDAMTSTTARLDMMNDGLQTTAELNDMIFASAQRSRGAYQETADLVSKLGVLAGDAFGSSAEIVAFAEQVNKQMTIAGTSTAGAQAAMLQLTQAMSSGVLRGEELNSILGQAPTIAQSIADYLGVSVGVMREMASEGQITAQVVKNAMFAAAEETNAKFESMPYTWGQVWTSMKNTITQTFQPALDAIGKLADLAGENIDTVVGLLYGLAAAALVYAAGQAIATGAAKTFFATLLSNPLTYIAIAIGIVVAAVYNWVQSVGGLEIAWLKCSDTVLTAWDGLVIGFTGLWYSIQNFGGLISLKFVEIAYNVADAVGSMKVSVLTIIQEMVNGAIDLINSFTSAINSILGTSIGAIDHVTFAATAAAEYQANKQARADDLAQRQADYDKAVAERDAALDKMQADRLADHAARQEEISKRQAAGTSAGASPDEYGPQTEENTASTAASAGNIEKSLDIAEEELKNLVDMAERQYVNKINLTAQSPVITINGQNTGNTAADRQRLADTLRDVLLEQINAGSATTTARAFSMG